MTWYRWRHDSKTTRWHHPGSGMGPFVGPAACGVSIGAYNLTTESHSNPPEDERCRTCQKILDGRVAQQVELESGSLGNPTNTAVAGSIPAPPTTQNLNAPSFDELFDLYGLSHDEWEVERATIGPSVWARVQRKQPVAVCVEDILEDIKRASEQHYVPRPAPGTGAPGTTVLCLFDAHLGKLAVEREAQTLELSREWIMDTLSRLAAKCGGQTREVMLPIGNDFLNVDCLLGTTSSGRVRPESNASPSEALTFARYTLQEMTEFCLSHWDEVFVIPVGGNHDGYSTLALAHMIDARFHAEPRLRVDLSPYSRKYYKRGANCFGFTHGKQPTRDRLFKLFPLEADEAGAYSGTKNRVVYTGHIHKKEVEEDHGITVKAVRALSDTDLWHWDNGFRGARKGGEADVWAEDGSWKDNYEVFL